ncbi:MAG: heme-copper oxidase subunit III [Anaerolineae bacterium]|nr:heme-copper oxidase subunit III [Anaerolineae bacterium]
MERTAVESQLSRAELIALRNKRTGLAIFQISWIMAFVCMAVVHGWIRATSPSWPPPGVDQISPVVPTAMTLALIVSCFFARQAVRAVKGDQQAALLLNWGITLGLGVLFTLVMIYEWVTIPFSGQYSTVFRLLVGFHAVHALVVGIYMIRVYQNARRGQYHPANTWPVEGGASLWYFVTVAWLIFYVVLFVI